MSNDRLFILALSAIEKQYKTFDIISVVDYQDWFVFCICPSSIVDETKNIMPLVAFVKSSRSLIGFNPMQHDPEKYFECSKKNIITFK